MIKDRRIVALAVVAVVLISSGLGIYFGVNSYHPSTSDIQKMTWGEIADVADGTQVCIAMGSDTYTTRWLNYVVAPLAKDWYGIDLISVGDATYEDVVNEWKSDPKKSGSYDIIWGNKTTLEGLLDVDGKGANLLFQSDWESKIPKVNVSDKMADEQWKFVYESIYGEETYSREVCSVAPFSGKTISFVYNKEFNDPAIKYNEVKVSKTSDAGATWKDYVVKVSESGKEFDKDNIDISKTYSLSSVRAVCRDGIDDSITCYYGLPHDFTELASWVALYPYQFYLPSTDGDSGFYTQLILESMIYELASANADGTEWTSCIDENAYVWSHDLKGEFCKDDEPEEQKDPKVKYTEADLKNKATYKEYIDSKIFSVKTGANYADTVPYLKAYLDQIMPKLNQEYTAYTGDIRDCNINLIGNLVPSVDYDDSSSNTKVMIAFSLANNMSVDTDPYTADVGMYVMDTACSDRYGLFIPFNASNPAGAIVICNLLNNSYIQATYYDILGSDHNMNADRLGEEQDFHFRTVTSEWLVLDRPFVDFDSLNKSRTSAPIGYRGDQLSDYAGPLIRKDA